MLEGKRRLRIMCYVQWVIVKQPRPCKIVAQAGLEGAIRGGKDEDLMDHFSTHQRSISCALILIPGVLQKMPNFTLNIIFRDLYFVKEE
jgi:hypothetical protein